MKTLKEFDYDLWTTEENSIKKYYTRVKATGEIAEVSLEVMRFLRNEEKRMRREFTQTDDEDSTLSLDVVCTDNDTDEAAWLMDSVNVESDVTSNIAENEFVSLLTEKQRDVYLNCIQGGQLMSEYAVKHGTTKQAVMKTINQIREKAKKFFLTVYFE